MSKRLSLLLFLLLIITPSFAQEIQEEILPEDKSLPEVQQNEKPKLKAPIPVDSKQEITQEQPKNNIEQPNNEEQTFHDMSSYINNIKNKITKNWNPSEVEKPLKVISAIKIKKDGSLLSIDFTKATGISEYDKPAFIAIKRSLPFEAIPEGYNVDDIEIDYVFDYSKFSKQSLEEYEAEKIQQLQQLQQEEELKKAEEEELKKQQEEQLKEEKKKKLLEKRRKLYKRRMLERQYAIDTHEKILTKWKPVRYMLYSHQYKNNVTAEIMVNKNGELESCKIVHSELDKKAERNAIKTIKKTAPFEPFPEEVTKSRMMLRVKFGNHADLGPSYRFE